MPNCQECRRGRCPTCGGSGTRGTQTTSRCEACAGSGECRTCRGTGNAPETEYRCDVCKNRYRAPAYAGDPGCPRKSSHPG